MSMSMGGTSSADQNPVAGLQIQCSKHTSMLTSLWYGYVYAIGHSMGKVRAN